jgi:uncharacterized Tic20 family protein
MESLAYLVVIIFMITLFSGPFAIALTSRRLVKFLNSKESVPWAIVNVLRKIVHAITTIIGTFLGFSLMSMGGVTVAKFFGAYAIVLAYIAVRREYFPDFHLLATIGNKLGIRKVGPGDHGPKVKWKKNGRSSGDDGHGPGGQH